MICPTALYNFGKVCSNSSLAGDVLRYLCGQAIELSPEARLVVDMISNDNTWMDERIAEKRAAAAERQRKAREKKNESKSHDVTQCHSDKCDVTQCHTQECDVTPVTQCHTEECDVTQCHTCHSDKRLSHTLNNLLTNLPTNLPTITLDISNDISSSDSRAHEESKRPSYVPTDDEAILYGSQINVPAEYVTKFLSIMESRGWAYINRAGNTVELNRRNFKAILGGFWNQEQEKSSQKRGAILEASTFKQEGYDADRLGI